MDTYQVGGGNPDAIHGNFSRLFVKLDREAAQKAKAAEKKVESKPSFSAPVDVSAVSINLGYEDLWTVLICSNAPTLLGSSVGDLSKLSISQKQSEPVVQVKPRPVARVVSPRENTARVPAQQLQQGENLASKMIYGVDPAKTGGEYKWSVNPKLVQVLPVITSTYS